MRPMNMEKNKLTYEIQDMLYEKPGLVGASVKQAAMLKKKYGFADCFFDEMELAELNKVEDVGADDVESD